MTQLSPPDSSSGNYYSLLVFFGRSLDLCNTQQERENYEYVVVEGKIKQQQTGNFLDTNKGLPGAKWIFVMSTSKTLYAGEVRF